MKLATGARRFFAIAGVTTLAAFAVGGRDSAAKNATTQDVVRVFAETCLASLPNFTNFSVSVEGVPLKAADNAGRFENAHILRGKRLMVGLIKVPDVTLCNLTVDSNDNPETIGAAILSSARSVTGNGQERRFATASLEFAIQLSNGSLITQEVKVGTEGNTNVFFLTAPTSEEQIRTLLHIM